MIIPSLFVSRIELPLRDITPESFSEFHDENRKNIKKLIIVQQNYYYYYQRCQFLSSAITIPDMITHLTEVTSITIRALVESLPKCLCNLKKLELLDLTGCYNILSIPSDILAMPNLKIRIGNVISPTSEFIVIKIPKRRISSDIFSVLSNRNKRNISQLIIHQESEKSYSGEDGREEVIIPDKLCTVEGIKAIWIRGNILNVPSWIFKQRHLEMLGLCGHFESLPELLGDLTELITLDLTGCENVVTLPLSLGNLSQLTSLDLNGCHHLEYLPSSMQNLPHLTKGKLTDCEFKSIPSEIDYLKEVTELDLTGCRNLGSLPSCIGDLSKLYSLNLSNCWALVSLPESIGNLSSLTSLDLSGCYNLLSLPSSIGNLSNLTSFNLSGCSRFVLPESIGNLSNLTSLILSGCENLQSLPERVLGISLTSLLLI